MRSSIDRRKSIVVLSPRGIDVIDQLLHSRREQAARALGGLDVAQLETLNRLLDAVLASLTIADPAAPGSVALRRAS
jgi:DNA-binding MarR family transcriptional regulator